VCICVVYVSPEGSSIHENRNLGIHMKLAQQINKLHDDGKACYVVGDFNGRTANGADYVMMDNQSVHLPLDEDCQVDEHLPIIITKIQLLTIMGECY
jgi:hypothetical protein